MRSTHNNTEIAGSRLPAAEVLVARTTTFRGLLLSSRTPLVTKVASMVVAAGSAMSPGALLNFVGVMSVRAIQSSKLGNMQAREGRGFPARSLRPDAWVSTGGWPE